jgi:hypothetical protein
MTHSELVRIAYKYCLLRLSCGVALRELKTTANEICDVIGFGNGTHSVVIEVKVSRADFVADKMKGFRLNSAEGMGRNRYYCCPEGLIKKEELPEGWGLIYVNENKKAYMKWRPIVDVVNQHGDNIRQVFPHNCNEKAERNVMYSALRRLQITNHIELCYLDEEARRLHKYSVVENKP